MKSMTMMTVNNCHKCATPPRDAGTRNQLEERRDYSGLSRPGTRSRPREHQRDFETMADSRSMPPKARKTKDVTGNTCTICGREGNLVCPCQTTRYCSKECQAVDWKDRGHKKACRKIRAEREEEAKRSEAPTPPSSPTPVFYGPAERTHADEVRARIKAEHEAARARHEANPEPEAIYGRFGKGCPICLEDWDVNEPPGTMCLFTCCCGVTCASCSNKIRREKMPCPLCREQKPFTDTHKETLTRMRRHAENNVPEAIKDMGDSYFYGKLGLVKSPKKAVRLYERAIDLGDVSAMYFLALLYSEGATGVKLDKKKAAHLLRMAADRGYAKAQCKLSALHANTVPRDIDEAVRLCRLAAAQGLTEAQFNLAIVHATGDGVTRNLEEAMRLLLLCAAKGHSGADEQLAEVMAELENAWAMQDEIDGWADDTSDDDDDDDDEGWETVSDEEADEDPPREAPG